MTNSSANTLTLKPRKAEVLFAILIIALSLGGLATYALMSSASASSTIIATISRDGEPLETVNLSTVEEPYEIRLEDEHGYNVIQVEPGRIRVVEANCPDHVCEQTGWISEPGAPIACIPHGLTITLEREEEAPDDLDAVSR